MTKENSLKEIEKIQESLSEIIKKLQKNEITPEEANKIGRELWEDFENIEKKKWDDI
jgi:hypothetical protein